MTLREINRVNKIMEFYKYCKNMFQHFTILCVCKTLKRKTDSFLNTHAYN